MNKLFPTNNDVPLINADLVSTDVMTNDQELNILNTSHNSQNSEELMPKGKATLVMYRKIVFDKKSGKPYLEALKNEEKQNFNLKIKIDIKSFRTNSDQYNKHANINYESYSKIKPYYSYTEDLMLKENLEKQDFNNYCILTCSVCKKIKEKDNQRLIQEFCNKCHYEIYYG